jgi:hypothetical protein
MRFNAYAGETERLSAWIEKANPFETRRSMSDFVLPDTRYAVSGDINIAYQTIGDGPTDIILVPGIISHVEFMHEFAGYTAFLRRLSNFARVVTFD